MSGVSRSLLDHILLYKKLRLAVLPVKFKSKRPEVRWSLLRQFLPTGREIRRFFFDGRPHNIGVICGSASGNLVVLDFDDFEAFGKFAKELEDLLARTPVVKTCRGTHVWFRLPKPVESTSLPEIGLEIKSEGRYVLAPPSVHPSGEPYVFISPPDQIAKIPSLEPLLKALAKRFGHLGRIPSFTAGASRRRARPLPSNAPCIAYILRGVPEGQRNEAAIRLASYYLATLKYDPDRALDELLRWNQRNRPPLDEREVEYVWRSELRRGYVYGCRGMAIFCPLDDARRDEVSQARRGRGLQPWDRGRPGLPRNAGCPADLPAGLPLVRLLRPAPAPRIQALGVLVLREGVRGEVRAR